MAPVLLLRIDLLLPRRESRVREDDELDPLNMIRVAQDGVGNLKIIAGLLELGHEVGAEGQIEEPLDLPERRLEMRRVQGLDLAAVTEVTHGKY